MRTARLTLALIGGLTLAPPSAAHAGSTTATIDVSLTVRPVCSVTAAPLAFAAIAGSAAEAHAPIEIDCTADTDVQVLLDSGAHAAGARRHMASETGETVPYAIYDDADRTHGWGANPVAGTAVPGRDLILVAYGRVEARDSAVAAGEYRDTVTVTVIF